MRYPPRFSLNYNLCRKGGGTETEMKATGIVRKVDELGRIVLPVETRNVLGIKTKDALEIYMDKDTIVLRKYEPACMFCGNAGEATRFGGKLICKECFKHISEQFEKGEVEGLGV